MGCTHPLTVYMVGLWSCTCDKCGLQASLYASYCNAYARSHSLHFETCRKAYAWVVLLCFKESDTADTVQPWAAWCFVFAVIRYYLQQQSVSTNPGILLRKVVLNCFKPIYFVQQNFFLTKQMFPYVNLKRLF